jgi:hypothetical protein
MAELEKPPSSAADPVRLERLRRDAERPMSENFAEGIALSHALLRFVGVACDAVPFRR